MQYHTIRVLCTFPVIVYVVLIDLNPQYMDFMYNVNAIFVSFFYSTDFVFLIAV
jgi:hypothetical protein